MCFHSNLRCQVPDSARGRLLDGAPVALATRGGSWLGSSIDSLGGSGIRRSTNIKNKNPHTTKTIGNMEKTRNSSTSGRT